MPEKTLRGHENQRSLMILKRGLGAKKVEVLSRRRAVGYPDIVVRRKLQKALEAGARVLGTLTFIAVRQKENQPRGLAPLGLPGDDELIDHRLSDVGEIPVLGLPQHERIPGVQRIAKLEAHNGDLRERTVVDIEGGP